MSKTIIDLMREYVRVADMVEAYNKEHGTDIKPWGCVKYADVVFNYHPNFNWGVHKYQFAVAILEGKPVFVGDKLWNTVYDYEMEVTGFTDAVISYKCPNIKHGRVEANRCTWQKPTPKRTFTLNGVELPCPVTDSDGFTLRITGFSGQDYYFDNNEDLIKLEQVLKTILTEARDKP